MFAYNLIMAQVRGSRFLRNLWLGVLILSIFTVLYVGYGLVVQESLGYWLPGGLLFLILFFLHYCTGFGEWLTSRALDEAFRVDYSEASRLLFPSAYQQ